MRLEYIMREKNTISNILKYRLGNCWIRFYPWFYIRKNQYDEIEFCSLITIWLIYGGISLGIFALAEIIQILHILDLKFGLKTKMVNNEII